MERKLRLKRTNNAIRVIAMHTEESTERGGRLLCSREYDQPIERMK